MTDNFNPTEWITIKEAELTGFFFLAYKLEGEMPSIFSSPFGSLDINDLRDLVEVRRVREHLHLDYKRDPYSHNRSDTIEMLADVTAMTNAQGGYILIGVEEDETKPDGAPKELIGIANGDEEAMWIQSVCLSSIDEKIIGLRVRDIPLSNGRSCVVVQVPNSLRKPHMIVYQKHRSFRIRHGRSKGFMGMQEVRNMIISMNRYRASLADFLDERKKALRDIAGKKPWILLMATPIYVDNEKIDPLRDDIRDVLLNAPGLPDRNYYGIGLGSGQPQPRLFGAEATRPSRPPYEQLLRLFRNGHLEYCEDLSAIPQEQPGEEMRIYSYRVTVTFLHFLKVAKQILQLAQVSEPVALTVHFENIASSFLWWRRRPFPSRPFVWYEPTLTIEFTVTKLSEPDIIARSVIDRLFNAFGYESNPHFDPDGNFVKQ